MAVVQNLKVFAACTGGSELLRLLIESRQKFSVSGTKGEFVFADLSALLFESTQVPPYESHKRIFLPTLLKTS